MVVCLCALGSSVAQAPPAQWGLGQEPITPIPPAPILDPRQVALGDRLFHDPRLSHDNTVSCNSCHDMSTNGAQASLLKSRTDAGPELNTPTVFNAALNYRLNWEGNVRTLEDQADQTLQKPQTMASSLDEVLKKLRVDQGLSKQFREAYGREMDGPGILHAISTYERSLLTPGCRFDLWLGGDAGAITPEELAGYRMFKSLGCVSCHQGVNVGGNMYQRHGIFHPLASPEPEIVRVPGLRNVAVTPPYFHDGSAATLPKAVEAMAYAQLDRVLTDDQTNAIVAFLNTLTGGVSREAPHAASRVVAEGGAPVRLLPGAAAACLLLALLTWLLVRGISTDATDYAATLRTFDDFALTEASLHRDVLRTRAGLLQDYDPVNAAMAQIDSAVARLRSEALKEGLDAAPVDRLTAATGLEDELTERFKSDNALLRNSLSYVGLLSTNPDFVERNPLLAKPIGALAAAILQLTLDSSTPPARLSRIVLPSLRSRLRSRGPTRQALRRS